MTWTVTERAAGDGGAGSSDMVSGSFTPAANSFLLAIIPRGGENPISGITGHGSWSQISLHEDIPETNRDTELWGCRVGGSPGASAVTISRGYTSRGSYQIVEFSETAGINGATVGDAVGTPAAASAYYGGSSPHTVSTTLASFAQSTNLALAIGLSSLTYTGSHWSADTGYTELSEWASGSSHFSNVTTYIGSEDTSPSVLLDTVFVTGAILAIEIKHAAGGETVTGSGTPAAQASTASGTAEREINAPTVALQVQSATVSGAGDIEAAVQLVLTAANGRELRDETDAVLANLSNIVWEWYDDPDSTAGDPIDSGTFTTDANGEATINVLGSSLTDGQYGQLVLYHPSDNEIRGTYRIPVTDS